MYALGHCADVWPALLTLYLCRLMFGTVGMVAVMLTCAGVFSTLYLHKLMFSMGLVYALGHCADVQPALLTLYLCRLMFGTVGMVVVMLTCAGVLAGGIYGLTELQQG